MQSLIPAGNFTFNAAARTITFNTTIPAGLERIVKIENYTRKAVVFQNTGANFTPGLGGTYARPVLTLDYDTTAFSNNDRLAVYYEDGTSPTPPFMRVGFSETGTGVVGNAADELLLLQTGSGMTVNQTGGNLVIATGVTANAETLIRSVRSFSGSLLSRLKLTTSQRIINQVFRYELADLIGENLAYTINSATSVTVTFVGTNRFTAANIGQSMRMGVITGAAGIPGRYAIASVSGLTVTFTVAGWPASGSGTMMLYGWNYIATDYQGAVATSMNFDVQRRGWSTGTQATTCRSTVTGHVQQIGYDVFTAGLGDSTLVSAPDYQWTSRASRIENIPDPEVDLYLFIDVQNGTTAPASTTTFTCGFVQVEDQGRQKVRIASSDPMGTHALPTQMIGGALTATLAASAVLAGDVSQQYRASATGAATFANCNCPATPAVQSLRAVAARLLGFTLTNNAASTRWLKVFNATAPTLGTTAAAFELAIPPGQTIALSLEGGLGFATAITVAITGGQGLTNNTAVTIGDVTGVFMYA